MSEQQSDSIWGKIGGWLLKKVLPDQAQGQAGSPQQSGAAPQQGDQGSLLQRLTGLVGGTDGIQNFFGGMIDKDLKPLLEMLKKLFQTFFRIANAIGNDRSDTPMTPAAAASHAAVPPPIPAQAQVQPPPIPQVAQTVETAPAAHPLVFPTGSRLEGLNGFGLGNPSCHPLPAMSVGQGLVPSRNP